MAQQNQFCLANMAGPVSEEAKRVADGLRWTGTSPACTASSSRAVHSTGRWLRPARRPMLAERDSRFAAVNLVRPEDGKSSLRNYSLQVRMVDYLRSVYPKTHVTLHGIQWSAGRRARAVRRCGGLWG
ncbi:hypothetical protein [Streptomyces sp. NPDC023327]|uniref:hypothetical protein n=1 Tax=Streptomyces sp. NPDC023327 TaxID=3157088 RepID=UPI0033F203E2